MSRFWSDVVHRLTPYVPGEQPALARPVKLNTNENPYSPSPRVLEAICRELGEDGESLRKYPDPQARGLREAVGRYHGLRSGQVFAGNGSDEVLAHVFQALLKQDKPILIPDITYSFYAVYAQLYGVAFDAIPLDTDFAIDIDDYRAPNGGVLIPNPNAPTGRALPLGKIEALLQANPDSVVVIDEAYVDFGAESAVGLIDSFSNLLVAQTVSKGRSLAGMRVGFALGDELLIQAVTRVKDGFNSYPLDRLAQVAAIAAYEDDAWFRETCSKVVKIRERLCVN
jgi:histidinol-phosphate aminotransferase